MEYSINGSSWTRLLSNTSRTSATFDAAGNGQYVQFQVRATDNAGNVQAWTGAQAATAHRNKDGVQGAVVLAQDFHTDGALPRDHIGIIVRMHVGKAGRFHQLLRMAGSFVVGIAVQHNFDFPSAARFDRIDLDLRCGARHDDGGLDTHFGGGQSNALGVVTRRSGHHTA